MSATETTTVTLTIDGRELTVPKGTPLVIAAADAGIEIPVFCWEPRLGPPLGACRMCLVEVEGMPKLQAACTMGATDGMVVHTESAKAKEGQDAILEFILLNHPLDCPVCDKGGECPLQDLTFRYGPSSSRMTLPKRTYEKPLPISNSITLDRERCILCYRCTRFSNDVAEDGELVARERGARSVIATFEERPYTNAFSGNVVELCPVGALLPVNYRFKARPWEIVNVPSVCQGCSVGCNTWTTYREGAPERVISRNHDEVDNGWLCDKGRFGRIVARGDRLRVPIIREQGGLKEASHDEAAQLAARRLRSTQSIAGPGSTAIVTGGDLTNEEAYAWSRIAEELGSMTAASPSHAAAAWDEVGPFQARIADLDRADLIVVIGDAEPSDRAGVIDLRLRAARRAGAVLAIVGPGGTDLERDAALHLPTAPASADAAIAQLTASVRAVGGAHVRPGSGEQAEAADAAAVRGLAERLAAAERPVIVTTDDVDLARLARLAWALSLDLRGGGILPLPAGANERGAALAGLEGGADHVLEGLESGRVKAIVLVNCDPILESADGERWQLALAQADEVISSSAYPNAVTSWSHIAFPAAVDLEREGSTTNLEGRTQRLRPIEKPAAGVPDLAWIRAIAAQLRVELPAAAGKVFAELVERREAFAGLSWKDLNGRAALAARTPAAAAEPSAPLAAATVPAAPADGALRLIAPRPLFAGRSSEAAAELAHQRAPWVMLARADAERLALKDGDAVTVRTAAGEHTGPLRSSRRLQPGSVRINWYGAAPGATAAVVSEAGA